MAKQLTHAEQVGRDCAKRARGKWSHGWGRLSDAQRQDAVSYEIVGIVLTQEAQHTDTLGYLQEVARAAFAAIDPDNG